MIVPENTCCMTCLDFKAIPDVNGNHTGKCDALSVAQFSRSANIIAHAETVEGDEFGDFIIGLPREFFCNQHPNLRNQ